MKFLFPISLITSALVLSGCTPPAQQTEMSLPIVTAYNVNDQATADKLYFPAVATAADRSHLSFRVAGEIQKLVVKAGDFVTKGQLIASIDTTDYRLAVDDAKARYSVANSQYKRSKPLVDKGLLAKSQFDELAAQRKIAKAELDLANLRLSFTSLRAPADGVISRVSVEEFENVQVGQQVVNIHSTTDVDIMLQVPDKVYANQPDAKVIDTIESIVRLDNGSEYIAKIKEFTTEPDPASGSYMVTLTMPMPEDKFILDGMAVEVTTDSKEVGINTPEGISIPIEAIFNADGDKLNSLEKYVWVINDQNVVTKQPVVTNKVSSGGVRVVKGINQGDRIVIAGVSRLRDGMTVQLSKQEAQ
ncbi:efflux RND transporter periplasmic adaptor subunit [Vibrio sp. Of7-15]|uniref:efflux RND transporter periplasmic adaptor subunit n=1 Tax=Vibrio sp. Of7-15 TaxID=2724879 RepID=UPI001EF1EFB6|nr:efflux RND transporter periplasmic adaptor subunit [Vibrio sp. Of7-15]MCG7497090.1 efflux RND transporter periplasmic adaptor subunit [Vibrio sp. Of7-15]